MLSIEIDSSIRINTKKKGSEKDGEGEIDIILVD
jgi:hypothetical protein